MKSFPCFITLRIYKVLKLVNKVYHKIKCFITLRIYKVLKHGSAVALEDLSFITLRIYKVLKQLLGINITLFVLSH